MSNLTVKLEGKEQAEYIKAHFPAVKEVQKTALKFFKRLGVYKGNNVYFDPFTKTGTSYNWWEVVSLIGGKVVFNSYHYSQSTCKHQSKLRRLLDQLGIEIDIDVHAPKGLQDVAYAIDYMNRQVETLTQEAKRGRDGSWAQKHRLERIADFKQSVNSLSQAVKS